VLDTARPAAEQAAAGHDAGAGIILPARSMMVLATPNPGDGGEDY